MSAPEPAGHELSSSPAKVPWHFWLVLVSVAGYLGWRVIQGAALLVRWLFAL